MTAGRRSYPWKEIAASVRAADGAWTLHPSLRAVKHSTLRYAQTRAVPLYSSEDQWFEFARSNIGINREGESVFDLYIRHVRKGNDSE